MSASDTTGTGPAGASALPPTQLLERNIDRFTGSNLLLLGAPNDPTLVPLFRHHRGVVASFDYGAHLRHAQRIHDARAALTPLFVAAYPPPEPRHDLVVAFLQKGKEANDCLLATAAAAAAPGAHVFLVGENAAGIKPYGAKLAAHVGPLVSSDAARHCVLYEAICAQVRPEAPLDAWDTRYRVPAGADSVEVITLPGVFSHGRLDEGTALLLRHLPPDVQGTVLDFGCGSGVIGAVIASQHSQAHVVLVDANAFALEAAVRTFRANGLTPQSIRPVSGIDDLGDQRFDLIVTNPPFHQGIGTDYTVVSRFLESCERHLTDDGVLLLVANRFLPYERMVPKGLQVSLVVEDSKFKVLRGRRLRGQRPRH